MSARQEIVLEKILAYKNQNHMTSRQKNSETITKHIAVILTANLRVKKTVTVFPVTLMALDLANNVSIIPC